MKKFKNWLIDKLGGYTKEGVDPIIKENIRLAREVETLSEREDDYRKKIKHLSNLIEKDGDILKVAHMTFDAVTLQAEYVDGSESMGYSPVPLSYIKDNLETVLFKKAVKFIDLRVEDAFVGMPVKKYTATLCVGKKGVYR